MVHPSIITNDEFPENPIWTFAKKWGLNNTYSNYSSILTYNETGYVDYSSLLDDFETLYEDAAEAAGVLLTENGQDQTARSGLALAGWRPKIDDMASQAVEWWEWGESLRRYLYSCLIVLIKLQTGRMPIHPTRVPSSSALLVRT